MSLDIETGVKLIIIIIMQVLGLSIEDSSPADSDEDQQDSMTGDGRLVELLYDKVYENFLEEIDAVDNGIDASTEQK